MLKFTDMEFRTELAAQPSSHKVSYRKTVVTMGSCFSEMVGRKLGEGKFNVIANPFGIVFNPVSLCKLLEMAINQQGLADDGLLHTHQAVYHYDLHSSFHAESAQVLKSRFSEVGGAVRDSLRSASHLFLTWGTSFSYWINGAEGASLVANCHKQPQRLFDKRLLSLEEMRRAFVRIHDLLPQLNPKLAIVLTVSPVRHIKDGIVENQLSKSLLRVLCHELASDFGNVSYFPSYEWLMDDLRDYRFYKRDLLHPSDVAEDYIWQKFLDTFISEEDHSLYLRALRVQTALSHKPFHPNSGAHRKFLESLLDQMKSLSEVMDYSAEIEEVAFRLAR